MQYVFSLGKKAVRTIVYGNKKKKKEIVSLLPLYKDGFFNNTLLFLYIDGFLNNTPTVFVQGWLLE